MVERACEGVVVAIPLGNGWFGLGRALTFPIIEFYDFQSKEIPKLSELSDKPVAFRVWVMRSALTGRRWKRLGRLPLKPTEAGKRWFFKQHPDGSLFRTRDGDEEIPASWEGVSELERAAVWSPHHIEDRLRDHFSGRANKWVESLRARRVE